MVSKDLRQNLLAIRVEQNRIKHNPRKTKQTRSIQQTLTGLSRFFLQKRQQQQEEEANEQQTAEQGAAVEGEGLEEEERVDDDYPFATSGEKEGQRVTTHDRAVLMILIEVWKGPAWNGNANWGSDAPLEWWYNVSVRALRFPAKRP